MNAWVGRKASSHLTVHFVTARLWARVGECVIVSTGSSEWGNPGSCSSPPFPWGFSHSASLAVPVARSFPSLSPYAQVVMFLVLVVPERGVGALCWHWPPPVFSPAPGTQARGVFEALSRTLGISSLPSVLHSPSYLFSTCSELAMCRCNSGCSCSVARYAQPS